MNDSRNARILTRVSCSLASISLVQKLQMYVSITDASLVTLSGRLCVIFLHYGDGMFFC